MVWLAAIFILLAGAGYLLSQRSNRSDSGAEKSSGKKGGKGGRGGGATPVSVEKVKQGDMGVYINALGTVTPVYTVTITSRVAGQLMEVHYREGQIVHKGDLLAVIDPRPYEAAYTQAQGQLQRDQALLNNSRIDLERYHTAYSQHAIPEQTLATQQATVNQYEGTAKLDQGNVDAAKVNVDYSRITAPIDGRVGLRPVDPGNIVQANGTTALLTITQLQPITVIFTMAEDYIYDVATQMRAGHQLRVDALDRDNQTELAQGTVLTLDNQIDTATGTVKVRASFANRDYRLFPNEFVNARLLVKTLMRVNIIPTAAIQHNNEVSFVYVVGPNNTVQSRNITVATTDGLSAAVTGVKPGETLVTDGFDKLQDGTKVVIRPERSATGKGANPEASQPGAKQ
jgi:multidrug efflux system membrane fusion protein